MHQGSLLYLALVDQMGMGLYPRRFWVGIVCVPREEANQPYLGTHSLQVVRVGAGPVVAYVLTPGLVPGGLEDREGEK